MKNPDRLTMADQSALNILAKVTNEFCLFLFSSCVTQIAFDPTFDQTE